MAELVPPRVRDGEGIARRDIVAVELEDHDTGRRDIDREGAVGVTGVRGALRIRVVDEHWVDDGESGEGADRALERES